MLLMLETLGRRIKARKTVRDNGRRRRRKRRSERLGRFVVLGDAREFLTIESIVLEGDWGYTEYSK